MTRAFALTAVLFASGCMHHTQVGYLRAAAVDLPADVHTVLVIDRSAPGNFGEHVLAGSEGALTGETVLLDRRSADLALAALEGVLADGGRYELVSLRVAGRDVDTSIWDRELTARRVRELCRDARCDAVISLEALDSDTVATVQRTVDAAGVEYEGTQSSGVAATFRVYDGESGRVLDEHRTRVETHLTTGEQDTAAEAANGLPLQEAVLADASELGASYGRRISPHHAQVARVLFSGGSKQMREAKRAFARGNLERAIAVWTGVRDGEDLDLRARALHNLAVAAEISGDVDGALALATEAAALGGRDRTDTYVAALRDRQRNDARVADQLGVARVAVN